MEYLLGNPIFNLGEISVSGKCLQQRTKSPSTAGQFYSDSHNQVRQSSLDNRSLLIPKTLT